MFAPWEKVFGSPLPLGGQLPMGGRGGGVTTARENDTQSDRLAGGFLPPKHRPPLFLRPLR